MLKKKILSIVTALALIVPIIIPSNSYAQEIIQDANLRKLINKQAKESEDAAITEERLKGIDSIRAKRENFNVIQSLAGLEKADNLEYIELDDNIIADISPLANLKKLRTLSLENNRVADLSPLINLKNIRYLYLGDNKITDISALSNLENLKSLSIDNNNVSDISTLSNLKKLEYLGLFHANVTSLAPIIGLPKLEQLDIRGIEKFNPNIKNEVAQMTNLKGLSIGNLEDTSLNYLSNLTKLERLSIGYTNRFDEAEFKIKDLAPLASLNNLNELYFGLDENVANISALQSLNALEDVTVYNEVSQSIINELKKIPNLKKLKVRGKNINLDGVALKRLSIVNFEEVTDKFINDNASLEGLSISSKIDRNSGNYTEIKNIRKLGELKNLKFLAITAYNLTKEDISYLVQNLPNLIQLVIRSKDYIDMDIPEIKNSNIKIISQDTKAIFTSDTIENPIKHAGEYIQVKPTSIISAIGNNITEVLVLDNRDVSKIKIIDYENLVKKGFGVFGITYSKEIGNITYNGHISARIETLKEEQGKPQQEKVAHKITVDGAISDKAEAIQDDTVNLTAEKLKGNKIFDKWTSDDVTITNPTSTKASFTMIDKDVNIVANYKDYTPIDTIKITTDNILMTTLTTDVQLQVTPANHNDELTWTSSNKNVATVDGKGKVTARAKGQCEITVTTLSNKTAKVKIKVATENIPSSSSSSDDDNQNNNTNNTNKGTSGGGGGGGSSSSKPTQTQTNKTTQEKEQSDQGQQEQKEQTKEIKITDIMTSKQATEKVNKLKDTEQITWSKQAVIKVIQKGIMSGDTNGNFMPKKSVTRAEVAQVIANIIGKKAQTKIEVSDVDNNKWYAKAVQTVLENKIFTQDDKGNFRPESKITRAELFVVIAKLKDIKPLDNTRAKEVLSKYTDLGSIPSWAIGYASALVEKGIVSGEDNKINANDMLTREQLATIFANIVE